MKRSECGGISEHRLKTLHVRYETASDYEEGLLPRPRFCPFCGGHMKDRLAALSLDGLTYVVSMDVFRDVDEA